MSPPIGRDGGCIEGRSRPVQPSAEGIRVGCEQIVADAMISIGCRPFSALLPLKSALSRLGRRRGGWYGLSQSRWRSAQPIPPSVFLSE
jgi:hypothetical protein